MNKWKMVKDYFNSKEIGSEINRRQFIIDLNLLNKVNDSELADKYRVYLMNCGFLKKSTRTFNGIYILVKKIPDDFSLTNAYHFQNWTKKLCKRK